MKLIILVVFSLAATVCFHACDSDKPSKPSKPVVVADIAIDVGFLVKACIDTGFSADSCACVGEEAKALGVEHIDKMRAAPKDDDPALEAYYSGAEIGKTMAFLDSASVKCGIEGAQ